MWLLALELYLTSMGLIFFLIQWGYVVSVWHSSKNSRNDGPRIGKLLNAWLAAQVRDFIVVSAVVWAVFYHKLIFLASAWSNLWSKVKSREIWFLFWRLWSGSLRVGFKLPLRNGYCVLLCKDCGPTGSPRLSSQFCCRYSSPLYKRTDYLLITQAHPPVYFTSSLYHV